MENGQKLYIDRIPNGHYRFTLRYTDPMTGKKKRISCVRPTKSKQSYNSAEFELLEKLEGIISPAPDDLTLDKCLDLYCMDKQRVLREQTLIRNRIAISMVNSWIGGDVFVNKLTLACVKSVLLSHCEMNVTYNEKLRRYKAFLRWAYNNELLKSDFFNRLTPLPDNKKERIQDKFLEHDELIKLLDAMDQPVWNYVTRFAVMTGCRIGEIIALRDCNVTDDYIRILETHSNTTGKIGDTKTDGSRREIYIRPELKKLIDEIRRFMKVYKLQHGVPKSPFFFAGSDGGHINYCSYNQYLKENSEKILGHRITTHALRHTATSLLIASGVPLETVSRQLGHVDSKITKNIYLHVTQELRNRDQILLKNACILG